MDTSQRATPLQRRLTHHGYDAAEVADILGVTRQTVWAWTVGRAVPRGVHRRALGELLHCPPGDLFPDAGEDA